MIPKILKEYFAEFANFNLRAKCFTKAKNQVSTKMLTFMVANFTVAIFLFTQTKTNAESLCAKAG